MKRPAAFTLLMVALGVASPAHAAPAPGPSPAPKSGKVSLKVTGGQATKRARYVARGGVVKITGRVTPYVAGQTAVLEASRKGRVVSRQSAPIGPGGRVVFRLRTKRRGFLRLVVSHAATAQQAAFRSRGVRIRVVAFGAGLGRRGTGILVLQRALKDLGFAVPVTGRYDAGTSRAVLAFRKTNHMGRTGYASRRVVSLALRGRGAFRPRFPRAGTHVEFDWSRQVLAIVKRGRAHRVYHSSSGTPATPTVFGTFRFYRKDFGTNAKGMVHSSYFIRGYAIHGYRSVPTYPASHGCLRVPIPNALDIFREIWLGEKIMVYR